MSSLPTQPGEVVSFWRDAGPARWFKSDDAFDATFRDRFIAAHTAAASGALAEWETTAEGSLALVILLDQFPRNAFRGTARVYATDPLAREVAARAIAAGHDTGVDPALRRFLYLPFQHSESLADQDRSVALSESLGEDARRWAAHHREIVEHFGRFPHRNDILKRESTPDELQFLAEGGFGG